MREHLEEALKAAREAAKKAETMNEMAIHLMRVYALEERLTRLD